MGDLRDSIERLRAIPAKWKHLADPIGDLAKIRYEPDFDPWDDPKWAVPFVPCCAECNCDVPTRPHMFSEK
jgi:hypothetical protein